MTGIDSTHGQNGEFDFAPQNSQAGSGPSIDIVRLLLAVWKPLTYGLFAGLLAGVGLYLLLGPAYSAKTQVLVSKKASVPSNDREANRYGDRGDHVQLIQTDLIVEKAFQTHGLDRIPELMNARDPLREVTEDLKVTRSAGQESSFDNVLEIEYLHADKLVASTVVQAIVDSYRDFLNDTRSENARQLYQTLLARQQLLGEQVRDLEESYHDFRREAPVFLKGSPVVSLEGYAVPAPSRYEAELAAVEQAQNQNLRKRSSIRARLATLERKLAAKTPREVLEFWVLHSLSSGTSESGPGGAGGGTALTASPEKAQLDEQLLTARLLEQRLLHSLGEEHTSVRNVRQQIETVLDFYARQGLAPPTMHRQLSSRSAALGVDLVSVYRDTLEGQLKELDLDDENLAALHAEAERKVKLAELSEVEDQRRKDEIALKKRQQNQLFDQIAAYDVSKQQEGYRLQQISQVRIERSLKRLMKIVGGCGAAGIAIVFCLAYLRELYDTSLKSLDEIGFFTGSPLLGAIPLFESSEDADRLAKGSALSPSLCYYHRPGSREAEAFRSIRTTLFFSIQSGQQVLQVSSPEPGDGKSTTAANLAVSLAQSGKRVLLIDGDLRRPTQHLLFGSAQEIGLTDVLRRELDWQNALRPTTVEDLSLMTSGLCPDNPAELLSSAVFPGMLNQLRNEYDLVLLDSPPILAVSDPCIVAAHTDGLLLVVRMKKNKRAGLRRTQETLKAHGVRLIGTMANGFDPRIAEEAGYNYDAYGGYYTSSGSGPASSTRNTSGRRQPAHSL